MARVCVFCGNGGVTNEDAWPKWLIKLLDPDTKVIHELIGSEGRTVRRHETEGLAAKVRRVCGSCNNTWMSQLETTNQDLLTRLIRGLSTRLAESSQTEVARWLVKTGMMLDLSIHEQQVPRSHYQSFYATRDPLDYTVAWLSSFTTMASAPILSFLMQIGPIYGGYRLVEPTQLMEMRTVDCYLQTFKIGCLVGQVLWTNRQEFMEYAIRREGSDGHTNLWPNPQVTEWPTTRFQDFESFRAFGNRLYGYLTR